MTHVPGWTLPDQDAHDGGKVGEALTRRRGAHRYPYALLDPIDRTHIAVIVGLLIGALVSLFFGNHLAVWAGVL